MKIVGIDPGTKTACTTTDAHVFETISWNNKARNSTKKRVGQPKYFRLLNLWERLTENEAYTADLIVCEGAAGFIKGKAAVESSHKFRAVIELFCAINGIEYVEISPNDLKRFALGKGTGEKSEMIHAANKLGYVGHNDDEADSFLIAKWAVKNRQGDSI